MNVLELDRLVLREIEPSDKADVHEYASDAEVVRFMNWGPNSEEETMNFLKRSVDAQHVEPRLNYTLAIILRSENRLIGSCGIHISNQVNREGWIGYCLNKRYWGKGYATETAKALVKFGFNSLGLHRIFATCQPANSASAHVMENTGMKFEGHLRENILSKGKWHDSLIYAILETERTLDHKLE